MKKLFVLLFSTVLIGIGINMFLIPSQLINGGVFGVSLLIKYLWNFQVGHMLIILNLPIYLFSLFYDKSYFINAIIGLVFTSTIIDWLAPLNGLLNLPIITNAILGGIIIGIGVGHDAAITYKSRWGGFISTSHFKINRHQSRHCDFNH